MNSKERQRFVQNLAAENRKFYGTQDGQGVLRAFELTFEHHWIYLYELAQNALDAGAQAISLRPGQDGDSLVFQHDGPRPLETKDVEGLSKVFRSTKGASSVGFMGIGFKSVFSRFREVRVSGGGWTFRYELKRIVGEIYGDVQAELLGAVLPIWDEAIPEPDVGFTTRFELRQRVTPAADLRDDLEHLLPSDDRTVLAILASAGLRRLYLMDATWELGLNELSDGSVEATGLSESENLLWQLFPIEFEPSQEAVARFLEHRRIQPSPEDRARVYAEAARSRRVLGVLPLDDHGVAQPPKAGRVYATLPTEVLLPLGIHINADWLLSISRTGLRDLDVNAWQRSIVDHIADVVVSAVRWISSKQLQPPAARMAFRVLAPVEQNPIGLGRLLMHEDWQKRLAGNLAALPCLPVWNAKGDRLEYAMPSDVLTLPDPIATAIEEAPKLRGIVRGNLRVLATEVLAPEARAFLTRINTLREMEAAELEALWRNGLEDWWDGLTDSGMESRDLLFRLWGAVAQLQEDPDFENADLRCVRTAGGAWVSVADASYFREALPSAKEPGGAAARRLIESHLPDIASCIDDGWLPLLRQAAAKDGRNDALHSAVTWLEANGHPIDLRQAVEAAVTGLAATEAPNWNILVSFGRWVLHRQTRSELLTHVLVQGPGVAQVLPTCQALVADPYVERGASRRHLFPAMQTVSDAYLEQGEDSVDAHEWRRLFEQAGACSTLRTVLLETRCHRYKRQAVAEFLGIAESQVEPANDSGYQLFDVDVEPAFPKPSDSLEIRAALAPWLEDGFSALRNAGHRRCRSVYNHRREMKGATPAKWRVTLENLSWVPCQDGLLRQPRDVLPQPDLARDYVPVAALSGDLVAALKREGLQFGSSVPDAPALSRLVALGSELPAIELAAILGELREAQLTPDDHERLCQAVQELEVPTQRGDRVIVARLVRKIGSPHRGALGGWVRSIDSIEDSLRAELTSQGFPVDIPMTTTGGQALSYLQDVWRRSHVAPENLASEVRDVLPSAYAYCLIDQTDDNALSALWRSAVLCAAVFADREWIQLEHHEKPVYFDDLDDKRYCPDESRFTVVTAGHLGNTLEQQRQVAVALRLPLLSSTVAPEWDTGPDKLEADWICRFENLCILLTGIRSIDAQPSGTKADPEVTRPISLRNVQYLKLQVQVADNPPKVVRVNARLVGGEMIVTGSPIEFAADAAKELLKAYGFRQRGDLAADLTSTLTVIDVPESFDLAAQQLARSVGLPWSGQGSFEEPTTESQPEVDAGRQQRQTGPTGPTRNGLRRQNEGESDGGSFDMDRALAAEAALLKKLSQVRKGIIMPGEEEQALTELDQQEAEGDGTLGDEVYREIAAEYERQCDRMPELGDAHQAGWDLSSIDQKTGIKRLIEVKGKGVPWTSDEVVELSRAQVTRAFRTVLENEEYEWFLYVIERRNRGLYTVLPIQNPAKTAAKWLLVGDAWREAADEVKDIEWHEVELDGRLAVSVAPHEIPD